MAGSHSDYKKGEMEVSAQRGTFDGFMGLTIYGGSLIGLALLFAIFTVGGVGLSWPPALLLTLITGIVIGIALKLKGAWYASIIMLSIVTAIGCLIFSLVI